MSPLIFGQRYSVSIPSIDDQHSSLFESLNELHLAIRRGLQPSVIVRLLDDLLAYLRSHFSAEESILAKLNYPGLVEHHAIHLELAAQVANYAMRCKREDAAPSTHLIVFLRDWLTNHILHQDRAYSLWLTQSGARL